MQYDKDGNEYEFLMFMILDKCHCNDKYIPTKKLFDLICDIYFSPVPKENLQVINHQIKLLMSSLVDWKLERSSDSRVDTTENICLYDATLKSLELSTNHLIWILHPKDDLAYLMTSLDVVLSDRYHNIRQFISNHVSFPLSFLTYNWNNIL